MPESLHLIHATPENIAKYRGKAAYIDRIADPISARQALLDAKIVQADGQDKDEFLSLYNGLKQLLAGEVKQLAYLVPERRVFEPFKYPPIVGTSNVRLIVFEEAHRNCKFNGFKFEDYAIVRYAGQSRKALDKLVELLREAHNEFVKRNKLDREPDNRPSTWLQRNENAGIDAPAIA